MALGKNTTVGKIEDIVRLKTGTLSDDTLSSNQMIDLIAFNCAELAKRLNEALAPFYESSDTLTLSGSVYPISSLKVDTIIKLVDSSLGIIGFVSGDQYERLSSFDVYDNSVLAVHEGEQIRIFKGSNLGAHGTIKLYYYRTATAPTARTDYPDIPDSFTATLIKMVCSDVMSYKNGGVTDAQKEQDIDNAVNQAKQAWANLQGIKDTK